jgi:hypothetical protein
MSFVLILVIFALLGLLWLWRFARSGKLEVRRIDDLAGRMQPVDLLAFRNLTDPQEDLFLRINLSPGEFRSIQKLRMRAALEYVQGASENAAVLLQLGQLAAQSDDVRTAQVGRELVDNAVQLRLYALLAAGKLYIRLVVPQANLSPAPLVQHYQRLSAVAGHLVAVQDPVRATQISAAL